MSLPKTMTDCSELNILDKVNAAIKIEAKLTRRLEEVEPWLPSAARTRNPSLPRVRPIPTTMDQVSSVLAFARTLAARTSAPAGWNPNAPVMGFSTPSPLPHHLRGGALAALQLQKAQAAQQESKRKKTKLEEQQQHQTQDMDIDQPSKQSQEMASPTSSQLDPKRREVSVHNKDLERSVSDLERQEQQRRRQQRPAATPVASKVDVSMNLSDSSSEEDDDDE